MQVQAMNLGITDIHVANTNGGMVNPPYRLFCYLDGLSPAMREQKRLAVLKQLGLLETESVPVFDEATQTAARYLETPLCFLGMMVQDDFRIKSAIGLSRLGLMNPIASSRQISRQDAFSTYVVDSKQPLIIYDTLAESVFAQSMLVQHYGIRAYMGTPLITVEGDCIGALAVMDLEPHIFSLKDVEFLNLTARWCLREFEREQLSKTIKTEVESDILFVHQSTQEETPQSYPSPHIENQRQTTDHSLSYVKLKLLGQLTQELRTPLTAIIGMSSVLQGEVFGSLSSKQKEYLNIIHTSGQHLNSVVEEILKLGLVEEQAPQIQLTSVNVEMLCQQSINSLSQIAQQKRLHLRLSVEPGQRIWLLDKERVRQAVYYLLLSLIESAESGGDIRIHVSHRTNKLNIAVWISHPWLGDGLPQVLSYKNLNGQSSGHLSQYPELNDYLPQNQVLTVANLESALSGQSVTTESPQSPQELLGLLLSCHLIESHGGKVVVQGSESSGYRYVLMLPKIAAEDNS
ncbi:MAG: GAF domain-containing sensor histidine kinase [Microcystaceae cyanobacterium]